ncbi:MAG: peptidoglycan DD-metalloendopeptidase family protein [Flavobacteriales bacterium]|jgi:lipoprotein NlpD|nr:peptidoglycan DD-metalloendopeptidase family protein [Flavobacteriales bacterium]MBK7942956.1 peptidoglycan DD-metalloendopeptidase family protein [Flavobacteriales bacterium]MBK8947544.1 peptidoglycan DD-metalloendopeptidase family protein [Flavobacteriales bacterium]MBK9698645.1 peptidoglycan DD-metalloendopeptidase family protein [Flavobacteriales bacterium]MBL8009073.1 peptidoglycan DD-metalloendopeptidase family protein [Flavobacteriales bacterium]
MAEPTAPRPRKQVLRKLKSKYRLLLINDRTFEERFSIRLSRLNVLLLAIAAFTLHGLMVAAIIVLTPLKRYIPGYSDQETKLNAYRSTLLADSLDQRLEEQALYIANLQRVLRGEVAADTSFRLRPVQQVPSAEDLRPGLKDSLLRLKVKEEEAYALSEASGQAGERRALAGVFFFPPLRGIVTSTFDRAQGHFGIDVVTKADEAVKACLDGTVTLASWTSDGGHVLHVQHRGDLVSVYKHNSVLLKKAGDKVKAGEAIAIVGDSGELSTGPHLHFELWLNGEAIDPQSYMLFK